MKKQKSIEAKKKGNNYLFTALILLLVVFVPLVISGLTLNPFNAVKTLVYRILIIIFLSAFFIKRIASGKITLSGTPLLLPASVFVTICLCSAINITNPYVFLDSFSELLLSALFSLALIQSLNKRDYTYIAVASSITGTIISLIGIYQYYSAESFNLANSVKSTLGHSNFLAHYLIIVIPLTLSLVLYSTKRLYSLIYSAFFLVQITALALTFARGGWIASIASILIFAMASIKVSTENRAYILKRIGAFLVIAVLLTAGVAATKPHVFKALFIPFEKMQKVASGEESEFKYKIVTILVRLEMWKGTIDMIQSNPIFGVGLGNYWIVSQKYRTPNELKMDYDMLKWAHNDFLQIGAETGFFGMIAFLFLLIIIFRESIKKLKTLDKSEKFIFTGFLCALAATVIHSLVSFNFYKTVPVMYFWITAAYLTGKNQKTVVFNMPKSRFYKISLCAFVTIAALFGIYFYTTQFAGEILFSISERHSVNKQWEKSIPNLKKALAYSPNNAKFRYALGLSYFKTGNFKDSIEECNKASALTPYVSDINRLLGYAHNELGNVYFQKKKYAKALIEYNRVIETTEARMELKLRPHEVGILMKERANAYYNRGNLHTLHGNYLKARDDYEKALRFNPQHFLARKGLDKVISILSLKLQNQPEYP